MARLPTAVALAAAVALAGAQPANGAPGWVWPLRGDVVTPYRNGGGPYAGGQHRGIDIASRVGAPVVASTAGTVRFAGVAGYSGLTVGVRTADGRYDTSYLHLSSISVRESQRLRAGQRVGAVGTTGRRSAARPHLHFGVRDAGSRHGYHDPLDFLPPPARPRPAPRRPPLPVGAPTRPSPAPSSRPRLAPLRAPRTVPRPAPRTAPGRAPRALPRLRPVPGLDAGPAAAPRAVPAYRGSSAGAPAAGPAPHPSPAPAPARRRAAAADRGAPGRDLGWALACLGLLLAAALMGTRRNGDDGAVAGDRALAARIGALPARIGAWLRPLAGRS